MSYKYIGVFSDSNYGPDFEGQLFTSIEDAKRFLTIAYYRGGQERVKRVNLDQSTTSDFMPCVSMDAEILLYAWDSTDTPVTEYCYPDYRVSLSSKGFSKSERV